MSVESISGLRSPSIGQVPMSDEQFSRWVLFLEKRTGIVMPSTRREFLQSNLRSRMREIGAMSFDDYYQSLQGGPKAAVEWAILVDRLTVHQTHFFRHPPSFALLSDWLDKRFAQDGVLSTWSVGCSTGEEPYSLAMQIEAAVFKSGKRIQYGVSGTDVSQLSLMTAKRGIYSNAKLKEIPASMQARFVKPMGADAFEVVEALRRRVAFSPFNLLEIDRTGLKPFDLIYCQNVMIYFSRERRVSLLNAFAKLLSPEGLLVIGPGEVINYGNLGLRRLDNKNVLAFTKSDPVSDPLNSIG
jgi:type IV pilus assembly protein PilK